MKKKWIGMLCVCAMLTGLAGCGTYETDDTSVSSDTPVSSSADTSTSTDTGAAAGAEADTSAGGEKILRIPTSGEASTFDPSKLNGVTDQIVIRPTQETLVRNTSGRITPGIAETWEISADGLTYTFHLREAYWSDGVQVTAGDFVYSMQRLLDPDTGSVYAYIGEDIKNGYAVECGQAELSELGVTAIDDLTLEIVLENPTPYFLSKIGGNLQFAPIRKDIVEQYGADFAATAKENVYCGPFVLASTDNLTYVYEKNETYWDAASIHLDGCEMPVITDENTRLALYESGELDYVEIPSAQIAGYNEIDGEFVDGAVYYWYIKNDSENTILTNKNFRLALNYGLDRNTYVALATDNVQEPTNRFVLPQVSGVSKVSYGEEYPMDIYPMGGDQEKAQECLAAAMKEEGIADASDITVTITTYDRESAKQWAEVAQELWQQSLGITVKIDQVTYSELYGITLPNGEFEICFGGWVPDYDDPYTYLELFKSDVGYYDLGFVNKEYDSLLEASRTEPDEQKRMDMLAEAEQILLEEAAFVPTHLSTRHYLLSDKVSGLELYFLGSTVDWVYADIAN